MERKLTDREYHVQYNADVEYKDVKMYCNTNQFPELSFCGPNFKTHGARGLSTNYHLRFDTKLGMVVCAICRIPCAFVACTSTQINSHNYPSVVHIPNLMDQGVRVSIIICVLIQN